MCDVIGYIYLLFHTMRIIYKQTTQHNNIHWPQGGHEHITSMHIHDKGQRSEISDLT